MLHGKLLDWSLCPCGPRLSFLGYLSLIALIEIALLRHPARTNAHRGAGCCSPSLCSTRQTSYRTRRPGRPCCRPSTLASSPLVPSHSRRSVDLRRPYLALPAGLRAPGYLPSLCSNVLTSAHHLIAPRFPPTAPCPHPCTSQKKRRPSEGPRLPRSSSPRNTAPWSVGSCASRTFASCLGSSEPVSAFFLSGRDTRGARRAHFEPAPPVNGQTSCRTSTASAWATLAR